MKQRVAARLLLASCTLAIGIGLGAAIVITGLLDADAEGAGDDLSAVGRGLLVTVLFTALAVLLAARALVTVRRLQATGGTPEDGTADS